jgi:hypothetical protein
MWWGRSDWFYLLPPGVTMTFPPEGFRFSGSVITLPTLLTPPDPFPPWYFELRSQYFLDPSRMPTTGEAFIAMPKVTFGGGLALAGGPPGQETGVASCNIELRQILRWDDEQAASSVVEWNVGYVNFADIILGKNVLLPQKRDYGALFFNLDRTRTITVTLVTRLTWYALMGGIIAFAPLVLGIPPWQVHSLD